MLFPACLFRLMAMAMHDLFHLGGLQIVIGIHHHQVITLLDPIDIGRQVMISGRDTAQTAQPGTKTGTKQGRADNGATLQIGSPGIKPCQQEAAEQASRHTDNRTEKPRMHDVGFFPRGGAMYMSLGDGHGVGAHDMQAVFTDPCLTQFTGDALNGRE